MQTDPDGGAKINLGANQQDTPGDVSETQAFRTLTSSLFNSAFDILVWSTFFDDILFRFSALLIY